MYQRVTFSDFRQAFHNHDRGNQFSYEGLKALFDYLEEQERDTGEEMELDVIELCGEYSEFENFEEFQGENPDIESMGQLRDKTMVLEFDGGFLVQAF